MLAGELLSRSCPCPHAQLAPLQAANARSWHSAAGPGLGSRGARAGVSLPTAHSARLEPGPGTLGQQPRAPLAEFGAAAGRVACQVGRGGQQGFSRSNPCWPTAAERQQWAARISWGAEGDHDPAARTLPNSREARSPCGWGRHSQSAECCTGSPCDRGSPEAASFLPGLPGVWCVCVCCRRGLVNFNICAAALFGPGKGTEISAAFLLLDTFSTRE